MGVKPSYGDRPTDERIPEQGVMKLKKRKIMYSAIFFLCWFGLLVFLVDGVLK